MISVQRLLSDNSISIFIWENKGWRECVSPRRRSGGREERARARKVLEDVALPPSSPHSIIYFIPVLSSRQKYFRKQLFFPCVPLGSFFFPLCDFMIAFILKIICFVDFECIFWNMCRVLLALDFLIAVQHFRFPTFLLHFASIDSHFHALN